jgi:uncharacterized Rossmann fold enzyme
MRRCPGTGNLKAFVGATDNDWFFFLAGLLGIDAANLWQMDGKHPFQKPKPVKNQALRITRLAKSRYLLLLG